MAGIFEGTQGAQLLRTYLVKKFLASLEKDLVVQKFTTKASIPPGGGKVARINTFSSPSGNTTALTEGSTNTAIDITVTGVNITVAEYGEWMKISSLQEIAQQPNARQEIVDRFAYGGRLTIDGLVMAQYQIATIGSINANAITAGAGAATATAMNAAAVMAAKKKLKDVYGVGFSNVPGIPSGEMVCIMGQQAELDVITEVSTGRMTWAQAVTNVPGRLGQDKWVAGYMGSVYGVACMTSQSIPTGLTVSAVNATCNIVAAEGAVGAVDFGDMNANIFINQPNANSTDNPFRNFLTCSYYILMGTKNLDVTRSVKLYSLGS